ncbi:phage tail sheath family protein [Anaerolentibacter hominis]|uniref:phage tail sheath family protein n=1 Tax=Anaerolentibacter hominis TaxID=3079009 RepID=UPI0031B82CED
MALGGGTFTAQNKILPGTYINFISAKRAGSLLGERGTAAIGAELDWMTDGEIVAVTNEDFIKHTADIFGYEYTDEKMKGLRDLFKNAVKVYFYRLNSGEKAENDYAAARCSGIRGNDIQIKIRKDAGDETKFEVLTLLGNKQMDIQVVASASDLKDNLFVTFKKSAELAVTAGTPLTGGTNSTDITAESHQAFLDKMESYTFQVLVCMSQAQEITGLYTQYVKRMREEAGAKFQVVGYRCTSDYEGVISVENQTEDAGWPEASAVYWTAGAQAACGVNESLTNRTYDGEFVISAGYTQSELEKALKSGKFVFHMVGDDIRVLEDINSYITYTDEKNSDFGSNQTIRVLDQIAMDIAGIFNNKYLGKIPNDASGRISLWNDIVTEHRQLEQIRAIENFNPDDVTVEIGEDKKSVVVGDQVTPVNAMAKLYMSVVVQ